MKSLKAILPRRVLSPIDRISEVLFGLVMVLTFTGSLSAAEAGRAEVTAMLMGAIGCNLAWGLIDAMMYLMGCLAERGSNARTARAIRQASSPSEAAIVIADALPPVLRQALQPDDMTSIHSRLSASTLTARSRIRLELADWLGAIAVFLLVFASTIPVVLPFLLLQDAQAALRASNAIAVLMMALCGYAFGELADYRPLATACVMVLLGCAVVALTIALGG